MPFAVLKAVYTGERLVFERSFQPTMKGLVKLPAADKAQRQPTFEYVVTVAVHDEPDSTIDQDLECSMRLQLREVSDHDESHLRTLWCPLPLPIVAQM